MLYNIIIATAVVGEVDPALKPELPPPELLKVSRVSRTTYCEAMVISLIKNLVSVKEESE
jgi:hypothetical protein